MEHRPFKVVDVGNNLKILVNYGGIKRNFSPEETSTMVLGRMKETAEEYLGATVSLRSLIPALLV